MDDNISCTIDYCDEENDTIVHIPDDSLCLDGLWCNGQETCDALLGCQNGTPINCDDNISCTIDSCDEGIDLTDNIGQCIFDTSNCECINDTDCDDNNPCTDDICTEEFICEHTFNTNPCDDGFFCTVNDMCKEGVCVGEQREVDDNISCTIDKCDEENNVILHIPNDTMCQDGLFCNGQEICDINLGCISGIPPAIDDNISCTIDSCDEEKDIILHIPDDSLCDDGLFCNGIERCDALLGCQAGVAPNCDDGINCTIDSCDEENDTCVHDDSPCYVPVAYWADLEGKKISQANISDTVKLVAENVDNNFSFEIWEDTDSYECRCFSWWEIL